MGNPAPTKLVWLVYEVPVTMTVGDATVAAGQALKTAGFQSRWSGVIDDSQADALKTALDSFGPKDVSMSSTVKSVEAPAETPKAKA